MPVDMNITKSVFAITALSCSFSVLADDQSSSPKVGIGLNYSIMYQEYKGGRTETSVLPTLFYDNDQLYVEGDEAGLYLKKDSKNELRLNVYYDDKELSPSGAISQLDKRKWSVMAGASYMRITPVGGFKIQLGHDVLGRSKGNMIKLGYLTEFDPGQWSIYPEVGLQWNDAKYNRYYYGVSQAESQRSGLATYTPKQSVQPYLSLNVNYTINKNWSVFAGVDAHYLANTQYDSPMVTRRVNIEPSVGFLFWY